MTATRPWWLFMVVFLVGWLCVLLAGCCRVTPKHSVCVERTPTAASTRAAVTAAKIDAAIDIQADVLDKMDNPRASRVAREVFLDVVRSAPPLVQWIDEPYFMCGSVEAVGCTNESYVRVVANNCIAHTALSHELLHVYIERVYGTTIANFGDGNHELPIWRAEPYWMLAQRRELCPELEPITP